MSSKQEQIDKILHKCTVMMANVGMNTSLDVGTRDKAKQLERKWLQEIKDIDPEQYKILVPDLHE